jgi:hypothetical protein
MAEYDPFSTLDVQAAAEAVEDIITQEIVNPIPYNSLFNLDVMTEFEKGLIIAFILIYIAGEL